MQKRSTRILQAFTTLCLLLYPALEGQSQEAFFALPQSVTAPAVPSQVPSGLNPGGRIQ